MELERMLSKEKQAIFNRVAKANVCRIVATRGEDYLRILHCSPEELRSNIIAEYSEEVVRELRVQLASDIKKMTKITLTRSWEYEKFDMDIKKYYQPDKKKKGGNNFVDKDQFTTSYFFSSLVICLLIKFKKTERKITFP